MGGPHGRRSHVDALDKRHQRAAQNLRARCRLSVNPCPAALVHVNPLVRETQTIAPIRRLAPYASLRPLLSAVSPAQTYRARPVRVSESP